MIATTALVRVSGIEALTEMSAPSRSATSIPTRTPATRPTVSMSASSMRPAAVTYQPVTASCTALMEDSPASCTMMQETTTIEGFAVLSTRATAAAASTATRPPRAWP